MFNFFWFLQKDFATAHAQWRESSPFVGQESGFWHDKYPSRVSVLLSIDLPAFSLPAEKLWEWS